MARLGPLATLAMALTLTGARAQAPTTVDGLPLRSALELQLAINASISAAAPGYRVRSGAYYFDDGAPLLLYRARDWKLSTDGGPVQLWFRATSTWKTGGVLIKECENVSISGLSVDYDPPATYQGTVLGAELAVEAPLPPVAACYRRMDVDLRKCIAPSSASLHTYNRAAGTWGTVPATNCYPGAGASVAPGPEPWPCCNNSHGKQPRSVTLQACKEACRAEALCTAVVTGPYVAPSPPPPAAVVPMLVRTDPGFPEPHEYEANHSTAVDPSDDSDGNQLVIWPKHIGYGCNRTLGCPGHFPGKLEPRNASLPRGVNRMLLLPSARAGDKVTISMRKGITWHVQNSTRVLTVRPTQQNSVPLCAQGTLFKTRLCSSMVHAIAAAVTVL